MSVRRGFARLDLSNVGWWMLRFFSVSKGLDEGMREDARRRLGLPPPVALGSFMALCLHSTGLLYFANLNSDQDYHDTEALIEFNLMLTKAAHRTLFKTERGLLGIGPSSLQEGDRICALYQSSLPVLLRGSSSHSGPDAYSELVGRCYDVGLSVQELGNKIRKEKLEIQAFNIV